MLQNRQLLELCEGNVGFSGRCTRHNSTITTSDLARVETSDVLPEKKDVA